MRVPVVAPAAAAAAAARLSNSAAAIAVAAANVPGVRVGDVRTAVIAAVPSQAGQVVDALSRVKPSSSLDQAPGTSAVAASVPDNANRTGCFRRVASHTHRVWLASLVLL